MCASFVWYRLEEHTADCFEQKKLNDKLQTDLAMQEEQNVTFKKVMTWFSLSFSCHATHGKAI